MTLIISELIVPLFLSFVLSLALTPILIRFAKPFRLIDEPDLSRKYQSESVPVIGGIVIFISILTTSFLGINLSNIGQLDSSYVAMWVIPCLIVFIVGIYDDVANLSPLKKIVGQLIAASIASGGAYSLNLRSEITSNSLVNFIITMCWIILITNSLNFVDNHDGVATIFSSLIFLSFFTLAYLTNQNLLITLSIVSLGSLIGFFPYNRPEARAYLGDAGSLLLGTSIAVTSLRIDTTAKSTLLSVISILVLLSFLMADTFLAIMTRIRSKRAIYLGGRDHIAHRLQIMGYSKKRTLALIILGTVPSIITSITINLVSERLAWAIVGLYLIYYSLTVFKLSKVPMKYE